LALYRILSRHDPPSRADLIFVLAGKMDRKQYGLELYRAGLAPRLLLSIGRFEVSRMPQLAVDFAAELISRRDRTAPHERHFFCEIDSSGTRISSPDLRRWSTYGEALGLRDYLVGRPATRVLVVSTDIHLRRVALTFEHVFRGSATQFRYCPAPASLGSASLSYVISEAVKLVGYRIILMMPEFLIRRFMRLR
jgi:uncharacterized SAM-binding protein YcdF (DUF218 family)